MVGTRGPVGQPTLSRRTKILIGVAVALVALLLIGPRIVGIWTDWLWYSDVGYSSVMKTMLVTRLLTFLIVALVVGAIIWAAVYFAYRSRPPYVMAAGPNDPLVRYRETAGRRPKLIALIPAVLIGLLAGLVAQASWTTVQTFLHRESFGTVDPQFGMDIGFYAFTLPFFRLLLDLVFLALGVAFVANLLTHYVFGGIRLGGGGRTGAVSTPARTQLAVIAGLFILAKAVAYWFDRYDLLNSDRRGDIFTGGTYTDINYVLPSKMILMVIAIVCALAFFSAIFLRDLRIPALSAVLLLLSSLVIGVLWPAAMEQFAVKPSAADREREYIQRNIAATREAYRIRPDVDITYENNWTRTPADPARVNSDEATLSNIRILDPNVLSKAFYQRQALRNVYGFPSQLAVDRYEVDGQQRDFVVAARELDPARLGENQTNWINKHTVFTHGNGFIAAQANTVDEASSNDSSSDRGGMPVFITADVESVKDPAFQARAPFKVTQPRIYFGELIAKVTPDYAIVGSTDGDREYDGDGAQYTYSADSGVPLGNIGTRMLYAIKYGERNFLLSNALNENSRILYNRDPRDRVKKAAPWLTVDSATYPAVMEDGSIKWIVDGYTTLPKYPYSQRMSLQDATADSRQANSGTTGRTQVNEEVSYVRNSVKATVDAYTGQVELYQADDSDPVLKTWMRVFPGTVKSKAELDAKPDLRKHLRYPEDLFKLQRSLLTRYHVNDAQTFFRASNFWSVPADPGTEEELNLKQPPYYFTASAPDQQNLPQFQLTAVVNFLARPNLAAYMTANSDPDNFGRLTVKTLPTDTQTVGPRQAAENMKTNGRVAQERRLLENTTVTFGNLLALPVGGNGILYVQPMYTEAKSGDSAMPKLYRVLTYYNAAAGVDGVRVGFAPTVGEALAQVGINPQAATPTQAGETAEVEEGEDGQTPAAATPAPQTSSPDRDQAVTQLGSALEEVRNAQSSGDLGRLGDALKKLDEAIGNYERANGGS